MVVFVQLRSGSHTPAVLIVVLRHKSALKVQVARSFLTCRTRGTVSNTYRKLLPWVSDPADAIGFRTSTAEDRWDRWWRPSRLHCAGLPHDEEERKAFCDLVYNRMIV